MYVLHVFLTNQIYLPIFIIFSAKDMHWLKSKLVRLGPMNMYYYRDIWNPPGDNYIEIISGKKEMSNDELVVLLAKVNKLN